LGFANYQLLIIEDPDEPWANGWFSDSANGNRTRISALKGQDNFKNYAFIGVFADSRIPPVVFCCHLLWSFGEKKTFSLCGGASASPSGRAWVPPEM